MSFVSYAQNFEDVMLWRALKHVENGFYIDVGANDPTADSVTKAFYERGWHGINIEPLPLHHADLLQERPLDINLQCAAGASNGEIEVWECDVRGWATAAADVMAQHTASGHKGALHKVPVSRLADICAQHVSGEIHFLKIDVEGFEKSVIDGADFSRFRPWILVIEATKPNSTEEIHGEWESLVLSADYSLGYTDGLNRFYVAKEHDELRESLRYPPNVFDEFIRSEQQDSEQRARQAEAKARQAEAKARQAEAASNERLAQLQAVYASSSWRLTKPIRAFKQILGGDFSILGRSTAIATLKTKQLIRAPIAIGIGYILNQPKLRSVLIPVFKSFPWLLPRLFRVMHNTGGVLGQEAYATFASFSLAHIDATLMQQAMTPRARRIYTDLKAVVDKKNRGNR
jgi:FkbM family methyltransferase